MDINNNNNPSSAQQAPVTPECDNCEEGAVVTCSECKKQLCMGCDKELHLKSKTKNHARQPLQEGKDQTAIPNDWNAPRNVVVPAKDITTARTICTALEQPDPLQHLGSLFAHGDFGETLVSRAKVRTFIGQSPDDTLFALGFRCTQLDIDLRHGIVTTASTLCLRQLQDNKKRRVLLTGMAMGGQFANVIALALLEAGMEGRVLCITFGQPPLPGMTEEARSALQPIRTASTVFNIYHSNDPLPALVEYLYRLQQHFQHNPEEVLLKQFCQAIEKHNMKTVGEIMAKNLLDESKQPHRVCAATVVELELELLDPMAIFPSLSGEPRWNSYQCDLSDGPACNRVGSWRLQAGQCSARIRGASSTVMLGRCGSLNSLTCMESPSGKVIHSGPLSLPVLRLQVVVAKGESFTLRGLVNLVSITLMEDPPHVDDDRNRVDRMQPWELYQMCQKVLESKVLQSETDCASLRDACSTLVSTVEWIGKNEVVDKTRFCRLPLEQQFAEAGVYTHGYFYYYSDENIPLFFLGLPIAAVPLLLWFVGCSVDLVTSPFQDRMSFGNMAEYAFFSKIHNSYRDACFYQASWASSALSADSDNLFALEAIAHVPVGKPDGGHQFVSSTHHLRILLRSLTVVGIVGLKGAGKSSMIHKTFGIEIRGEVKGSTHSMQLYSTDVPGLIIADYPGHDDSFSEALQDSAKWSFLSSAFVVLIDGRGKAGHKAATDFIETLTAIGTPFLVCFTQVDTANGEELGNLQRHKERLISNTIAGRQKLLHLPRDRFWLASFAPDPDFAQRIEDARRRGDIKDCEDIKQWIVARTTCEKDAITQEAMAVPWTKKVGTSQWFAGRYSEPSARADPRVPKLGVLAIAHPSLEPSLRDKWHLRDGTGIDHVCKECDLALYADAVDCWRDVEQALQRATKFIFITGWDFNPWLHLTRGASPGEELGVLLKAKAAAGVDVRLLLWDGPGAWVNPTVTARQVETYFMGSQVQAILVANLATSSHHQKMLICDDGSGEMITFTGGIDFAVGRFDTGDHPITPVREAGVYLQDWYTPENDGAEAVPQQRQPWHDIHCRVRGDAAFQIYRTFTARWNGQVKTDALDEKKIPDGVKAGSSIEFHWSLQVVRSQPKHVDGGQRTVHQSGIHEAYCEAIRKAQHFIYIENQYFISSSHKWRQPAGDEKKATNCVAFELVQRICRAIDEKKPFHVFVVIPLYPETKWSSKRGKWSGLKILSNEFRTFDYMLSAINDHIKGCHSNSKAEDYLSVYCLGQSDGRDRNMIYVHSKFMVVDDEYVIVGSANINQRSLGGDSDSELCVVGHETDLETHLPRRDGKVHQFRLQLFAEHLGLSLFSQCFPDASMSPLSGVANMRIIGDDNWARFRLGKEPLCCHLMSYPFNWRNGKLEPDWIPTATGSLKVLSDGSYYHDGEERPASTLKSDPGWLALTF